MLLIESPKPLQDRPTVRRRASWQLVVLMIGAVVIALRRAEYSYSDGDPLWCARAGLDFLRTGVMPRSDSYSWTASGRTWVPNSWGWNVVLAVAYRLAGTSAFVVLCVLSAVLCAELARRLGRRAGAHQAWTTITFVGVLAMFSTWLFARAQIVDLVAVLALQLAVPRLFGENRSDRRRTLAVAAAVQVLWMNLHTTAVLGPVAVAAAGLLVTVLGRGRRGAMACRTLVNTAVLSLACLATPYGLAPLENVSHVRAASVGLIEEWAPAGFTSLLGLLGVLGAALCALAAGAALRGRRFAVAAILALLAVATVSAVRFAPLAALSAVPELAAAASRARVRPRLVSALSIIGVGVLTVAVLLGFNGDLGRPGTDIASTGLVRKLPAGCRLLNDYTVGGSVLLYRPDIKVSIDGRNDMYGRAAELQARHILDDADYGTTFISQHDVTCVLVLTSYPIVRRLQSSGWRLAGRDASRSLLLRP